MSIPSQYPSTEAKESIWIGIDPGGEGNFGVAILFQDGRAETFCVDCADEAVTQVVDALLGAPSGIGIDAPLWWSSGRSSDRLVDQWLRRSYGLAGGNVQAANSLRGAALVQGVMFAQRMREKFPDIKITESHPKAIWAAMRIVKWSDFAIQYGLTVDIAGAQEHERDAIIAAVCAREGFEGRWPNDLRKQRHASEQDPATYWLAPVHYFWPE